MLCHLGLHSHFGVRHGIAAVLFVIIGLTCLSTERSLGAFFTLVDENSSASFDTTGANNYDWSVDGQDQLQQQAFWFRVGNAAEQTLTSLPIAVQGASDTDFNGDLDTLFVRYTGTGFRTEVRYTLDGGVAGSGVSNLSEQISITNTTASPLDFHFFQYSNFDIGGTAGNDSAVFTNANAVQQYGGSLRLSETVVTPVPTHREIATFPVTLGKLSDGVADNLSDTAIGAPVGPADVTWAYQWSVVIPAGGTYQVSKDKTMRTIAVPEPAALALVSIAGLLLVARRGRK